jgi:hypothetical protein
MCCRACVPICALLFVCFVALRVGRPPRSPEEMKHLRLDNILSSGRSNRAVVNKNTRSYLVPTEILKPASTNPEKKSGQIQVRLDRVESGLALSFAHWSREKEQVATLNPSCIQNRQ